MNDQEVIAAFLKEHRPEFDVRANVSLLSDRAGRPLTVEGLSSAVISIEHKLVLAPAYRSACDAFALYNPERNTIAHRRQFLGQMRLKEIQSAEMHEYNSLIQELDREDLRGIPLKDLRDIAGIQRENNRRKSLTGPQLHELAITERPLPTRGTLPSIWFGADISTPLALRMLAKKNIASFRALVERYGTREVNNFLGVKPTIQPGFSKSLKI